MGPIVALAGVVIVVIATLGVAFLVGMRAKSPLVIRPIVWFSRRFMNPAQMRTAGSPGAYASIIRHRGRRSGREYETPVGVAPDGDGFVIALPYGKRAQWLRNVLTAGSATLVTEGNTYEVERPELVPLEVVNDRFSPSDQRMHRWFRVEHCLRLRRAAAPAAVALAA